MAVTIRPASDHDLLRETVAAVRLLIRHTLTADLGGGVPHRALVHQMQRLDKLCGREWHDIPTGGQIHDIGKRKGTT